jgi:serine protease AprX
MFRTPRSFAKRYGRSTFCSPEQVVVSIVGSIEITLRVLVQHMSSQRRAQALLTALAVVGAAALAAAPVAGAASAANAAPAPGATAPASAGTWIVRLAGPGTTETVSRAVVAAGGRVISVQPALNMLVATLPAAAATGLGAVPGVLSLSPDATATPSSLRFEPASQRGALTTVNRSIGAQYLWKKGLTGAGVDVALIDTGVAPVDALDDPAKVVVGPDLSFDSQNLSTRYLDTYGHGTHMGSIIAGREAARSTGAAYAADTSSYYGVAPDARLVSVKVGASNGAVDVSQLIAAIDWVVQNKTSNGLNIKVLNLSFGTDSTQDWRVDPLSQAAEAAVRAGILVVVAGGNEGDRSSGLADPAYNPNVLAVGAVDTRGTDTYADDEVPSFSQHSDRALASRSPDLVAPGVRIVAPAVPGSTLATRYRDALVGGGKYLRGSGTSQAAAVESGAAALIWQKWPNLSPLQIREMLVDDTIRLGRTTRAYEGRGEVRLGPEAWIERPASSAAAAAAILGLDPSDVATGTGTLQGARGSQAVSIDGVTLRGEKDIFGRPWNSPALAALALSRTAWNGGVFNGSTWIGSGFGADTTTVAGETWSGRTWAGVTWTGSAWSGRTWAGRTWAGRTWAGGTWTGGRWDTSVRPGGSDFSGRTWAADAWR